MILMSRTVFPPRGRMSRGRNLSRLTAGSRHISFERVEERYLVVRQRRLRHPRTLLLRCYRWPRIHAADLTVQFAGALNLNASARACHYIRDVRRR